MYGKILTVLIVLAVLPADAQDAGVADLLGEYNAWRAYVRYEGEEKICYMVTEPEVLLPENVSHGNVMLMITHWPARSRRDEVMLLTGYAHEEGSEVTVTIGSLEEEMFTSADGAWLRNPESDDRVVAAMRAGQTMVSTGTSARGTDVEYQYSLSGVIAAHNAISRACS